MNAEKYYYENSFDKSLLRADSNIPRNHSIDICRLTGDGGCENKKNK